MKKNVIVIGAGAAGLMAARELSKHCHVVVIEARQQPGGRIRSEILPDKKYIIEAGAEFIHGKLPVTIGLLKEAGIEYVQTEDKTYRKEKNNWILQEEMIEKWDELLKKMKSVKDDITLDEFLSEFYPGDKYATFRRHIIAFAEGFDVADPKKVSLQSLYKEWSQQEENYRIPSGYGSLIHFLEEECKKNGTQMMYGDPVKQIDWQKDDVTVYTREGKKFTAHKIIVTLPVGVLRNIAGKASVNFTPPIDDYIHALNNIGYGQVIKFIFEFKQPFWMDDTGFILSDEMIPTWWPQSPLKTPILTGWAGGSKAESLMQHTDEELLEIAASSLCNIFNIEPAILRNNIISSNVYNWQKYDESLGAYSYSTPLSKSARKLLNTPLAETVFFAGEGVFDGDQSGIVESALLSGRQAAHKLLKLLG